MRWNGAFLIFAKRKKFFAFYKILTFNHLEASLARVRSISGKTIFQDVPKNFFWKSFGEWKNGFIMQCTRKPNNNGQQVRKKRIKKQVKTKQKKETDKPIRKSEKQRAFFVGNLFSWLGQTKIRPFVLERLKRVSNNHTARDGKPMPQVGTV